MLLAIDAGNSNIVFAVHDGERIRGQWRASTDDARTAEEHLVWLSNLMAFDGLDPAAIDRAILSTVVPQARMGLETLCRRFFGCEAMVIGDAGVRLPLEVLLERPSEGRVGPARQRGGRPHDLRGAARRGRLRHRHHPRHRGRRRKLRGRDHRPRHQPLDAAPCTWRPPSSPTSRSSARRGSSARAPSGRCSRGCSGATSPSSRGSWRGCARSSGRR